MNIGIFTYVKKRPGARTSQTKPFFNNYVILTFFVEKRCEAHALENRAKNMKYATSDCNTFLVRTWSAEIVKPFYSII